MKIEAFQKVVEHTWNQNMSGDECKTHAVLTLVTEAAEVADIWKKYKFSNRPDKPTEVDLDHLQDEVGDVLYGVLAVCNEFGIEPGECMRLTTRKLMARYNKTAGCG